MTLLLRKMQEVNQQFKERFLSVSEQTLHSIRHFLEMKTFFISFIANDDFEIVQASSTDNSLSSGNQTKLNQTICQHLISSKQKILTIEDTKLSPVHCDIPLVNQFNVRAYIGAPIILSDGRVFGTLCGVHDQPYTFSQKDIDLFKSMSSLLSYLLEVSESVYKDSLTGFYNRSLLDDFFQKLNPDESLGVLYIDLDRFKYINDSFGHLFGDKVLKEAAKRLKNVLKDNCIVIRLGGDEFLTIIPTVNSREELKNIAKEVILSFRKPFVIEAQQTYVTVSIGGCLYPQHGSSMEELIQRSDTSMYHAKDTGRNQLFIYSKENLSDRTRKILLKNALYTAIENRELKLVYQPKFDIRTREIVGVETLLRWENPALGTISPAEFIPLAEETGQIVEIGSWVFKEACQQNKKWQEKGLKPIHVAVNISIQQFFQENFIDFVLETLLELELNTFSIQLELTETMMNKDSKALLEVFNKLKDSGIKVDIDDFGMGFSTLYYLNHFPIHSLKIDPTYIRDLHKPTTSIILESVIDMAHKLGIIVTVEGVEDEHQFEIIKRCNADIAQGFLLGRPTTPSEIERLYLK